MRLFLRAVAARGFVSSLGTGVWMVEAGPTPEYLEVHSMTSLRFGVFAESYDLARPEYPIEAVDWALKDVHGAIAEVAAGSGKLTKSLLRLCATVVAIEPDVAMLQVLRHRLPDAVALRGVAEDLPLADASVDAVVVAQAWYWFDAPRAWEEALRVLAPAGRVVVMWNAPSLRPPWQRELADLGPVISPVREGWWPAGVPREGMQNRLFFWDERLTPTQVREECATHLSVRKLSGPARDRYLDGVQQLADRVAAARGDGVVAYERLTWCARTSYA